MLAKMQPLTEDRLQRKKRLFEFYGPKTKPSAQLAESSNDPANIDSSGFDPKSYMNDLLLKSDLNDLVAKETEICEQIRSLDSEMQTLVYDNYNKFINATHTIKMMKTDFKFIEDEMNSLAESMVEIKTFSSKIDDELREIRTSTKKLLTTADSLQKLGYLSSLPSKIRQFMEKEDWSRAIDAYVKAKAFFEKYRNVPSFRDINKECTELINDVVRKMEDGLNSARDFRALNSSLEVLLQFGQPASEFSKKFIDIASNHINALYENLASKQPASGSDDILSFANSAADIISEGVMSYAFVYSSRFLSNATLSANGDRIHEDLESQLFQFLRSETTKFIDFTKVEMQSRVKSSETNLLVRALQRLYSRLMDFGRSVLDVVSSPEESPSPASNDFKRHLDTASLNMVLVIAEHCCREKQLQTLKDQAADCLTDARQQLVTSVSSEANEDEGDNQSLMEIYEEMSRILASNLRNCLKALEPFLSSENSFSHLQLFLATFCLNYIREGIVTAYLRFLVQFCEDLSKCTPSSIPGCLILMMGKLCLDWANSGTIGHLLSSVDELLLMGLPKSSISTQSQQQQAIQQMSATRAQPLTPPGPLAEEFRTTATNLLTTFTKFEGAQLAHMMRKSVETRDWLRCPEPRTVRSVIRRVLEDLATLDSQVSQLLPLKTSGRGRGGKDSGGGGGRGSNDGRYSWRSSMSHLRSQIPSMTSGLAEGPGGSGTTGSTPEYDPALASQLRRLFHQRVDVFEPIKPNRESILFGVIKIALKALSECARTRTFGKFGLQQIQVDCHYLHIHLWRFVSDEKQIQTVLDDVMYSVIQRCVEPQLMDDSIVDAICDGSRVGSNLSFDEANRGPTMDIALDPVESRFLLTANSNGSLLLYDVQSPREINDRGSKSSVFCSLAHLTSIPPSLLPTSITGGSNSNYGNLCQSFCLQWNPVDTGSFFTVSVDCTLKIWDTNTAECVEAIATPEPMTWASLSPCAKEHNLIAVSLTKVHERHTVCIDPLVGAPCLSLLGGHTAPFLTQVLWSARNAFVLLTAGADGRVVFWDIRIPSKPVAALNKDYNEGDPLYSPEALAHSDGVKSLAHSPDGFHLFTWGGTGARGGYCLRVWSLQVDGQAPIARSTAQPRLPAAASATGCARCGIGGISARCVRLAVAGGESGWGPCPRFPAWEAEGALVFVPAEQALVVAAIDSRLHRPDSTKKSQWNIKRHFANMTACAWNAKKLELYTAGLDSNLYAWPLINSIATEDNSVGG
ncbi:hypothetical protein Aperf_G00000006090 [Anoplocephala perfoliata]